MTTGTGPGTIEAWHAHGARRRHREALLAAAHDLLATEGPGALTVRRIAAAAGVSTMNVYSRFGGKDGVLDELFVDGFRRLTATMEASPSSDDPIADLRAVRRRATAQFARENPTYYSLMFDRVVPDFEPSDAARRRRWPSLGQLAARVAAGDGRRAAAAGRRVQRRRRRCGRASTGWSSLEARMPTARRAVRLGRRSPRSPSTRMLDGLAART